MATPSTPGFRIRHVSFFFAALDKQRVKLQKQAPVPASDPVCDQQGLSPAAVLCEEQKNNAAKAAESVAAAAEAERLAVEAAEAAAEAAAGEAATCCMATLLRAKREPSLAVLWSGSRRPTLPPNIAGTCASMRKPDSMKRRSYGASTRSEAAYVPGRWRGFNKNERGLGTFRVARGQSG